MEKLKSCAFHPLKQLILLEKSPRNSNIILPATKVPGYIYPPGSNDLS